MSETENDMRDEPEAVGGDLEVSLRFDPGGYSERTLRLILSRAEEWGVPPAVAVARLLDEAAARGGRSVA